MFLIIYRNGNDSSSITLSPNCFNNTTNNILSFQDNSSSVMLYASRSDNFMILNKFGSVLESSN